MKALVMSDSHGMSTSLLYLIREVWSMYPGQHFDAYIHCGDGAGDFEEIAPQLRQHDPSAVLCGVLGNCDWSFTETDLIRRQSTLTLGGVRILVTHGHRYSVKSGLYQLDEAAAGMDCAVALYGHTHEPNLEARRTLLLNPGCAQEHRLGILEITDGKPNGRLLSL